MGVIIVIYGVGKLESWNNYIREDESCDRRKQLRITKYLLDLEFTIEKCKQWKIQTISRNGKLL